MKVPFELSTSLKKIYPKKTDEYLKKKRYNQLNQIGLYIFLPPLGMLATVPPPHTSHPTKTLHLYRGSPTRVIRALGKGEPEDAVRLRWVPAGGRGGRRRRGRLVVQCVLLLPFSSSSYEVTLG
jgi:hypothetical protein